jgi:4-amino-4-deoxy-L-arabinose transferase-like glycosyltransferase
MSGTPLANCCAWIHRRRWGLAIAAVTLIGLVLRIVRLHSGPDNYYYDAAVRSMTLSLHNFLYGAFEPGASASIDKPPFDLWLQVISVKILGWDSGPLKLPEALSGTLAVPLLYDLVRRVRGRFEAIVCAAVLAIVPVSVLTSRSDTMDSVMMLLLVATAWLLLRSVQRGELRWLLAAAVLLGIDFNVKLFEALVPLPAFVLFLWLCWRSNPIRLRVGRLAVAGALFVAVALSWIVFVSLTPASERPYPIGSTNGSVWNAVFVYNGWDRISQAPHPADFSVHAPSVAQKPSAQAHKAAATAQKKPEQLQSPAGPFRLFAFSAVDFGGFVGTVLFAALLFGAIAVVPAARRRFRLARDAPLAAVVERASLFGVAAWLIIGYALFSAAGRVHPRYLEAFTPAIAIVLGVSLCVLARRARDARGICLLLGAVLAVIVETRLTTGPGRLVHLGMYAGILVAILLAIGLARGWRAGGRNGTWNRWCAPELVACAVLLAVLACPFSRDIWIIKDANGDQASEVTIPNQLAEPLSAYLLAHQDGARYEVAVSSPQPAAPLIIRGLKPVLLLTSLDGEPLVTLSELRADAARGEVHYVFISGRCPVPPYHVLPACSQAAVWVRAHARDVTAQLGPIPAWVTTSLGVPPGKDLLYELGVPPLQSHKRP